MTTNSEFWKINIYIYIYFVPFLCSIYWFILESVQYHFKILAWWEDYDLPDGTLCVLFFLAVWPYWILRWETSLGFLGGGGECEISWSVCIAYLSPSVLHWMCSLWRQASHCRAVIWYRRWEKNGETIVKIFRHNKRQFDSYLGHLNDSIYVYFCALYQSKCDLLSYKARWNTHSIKLIIKTCA